LKIRTFYYSLFKKKFIRKILWEGKVNGKKKKVEKEKLMERGKINGTRLFRD